ncbi:hypothetical protein I309_06176 [Cryptococcus deuterogattii LA55]|nr:hypothetical protein I309_06176 [Cryptococcus deuterogattii LA55]KIR92591.1 hypothetical protein I304_03168 [Cryptococcus deuterogattii CBS 10090]KIR97912.1 hypothetical protein L804_04370 [Cryptococcus deuterogattii 2001/935-1]
MSLSNPLNLLLIPPLLYLAYRILVPAPQHTPPEYNSLPAEHPHVICYSTFTPAQLAQYDGTKGDRILLAIMRVGHDGKIDPNGERTVFDVSAGKTFYGPDVLTPVDKPLDDLSDLTPSEM